MSISTQLTIITLNEEGKECFKYEPENRSYSALVGILIGEAKMIKEGLLGMMSQEEIEYLKFENPWNEYEELDYSRIKIKDPKKLLDIMNKIKDHIISYELKDSYKKDFEEENTNWILSYVRSEINVLVELGKVTSILEMAVQNNCKVKAYLALM